MFPPISGPEFLFFYAALIAAGVLVHYLIRRGLAARAAREHRLETVLGQLTPGEVGYLRGAAPRAYAARAVALREGSATAAEWDRKHADPESRLEAWGLILNRGQLTSLHLWGLAIFGGILAAGVARVWIGIVRDKPVVYLLLMLAVVAYLLWRSTRSRRVITRLGRDVVATMTERYQAGVGDTSYAMGYALLGAAVLTPELSSHLRTQGLLATGGGYGVDTPYIGCSGGGCSGGGGGGGGGCGGCGGGGS